MREVPSELQGDLEAMRDILKNLNDALEGPEVEYERLYKQGTTHGRTFRPHHRVAVVVEPWHGQDPPADST